jgi:prevent-host-death family protein
VPDITTEIVRSTSDADTIWVEWQQRSTQASEQAVGKRQQHPEMVPATPLIPQQTPSSHHETEFPSGIASRLAGHIYLTIIQVMTTIIPLADAKARLSAVLDEVRDTHDRVVITRNGRPEAVIISVADLETIEDTLDLLSTPGAVDEIRTAEAEIARGEAIGTDELRRLMSERVRNERNSG